MATFDQCMFGRTSLVSELPVKKPTLICTNIPDIYMRFNNCLCDKCHTHQRVEGSEGGQSRSTVAAIYPLRMRLEIAEAVPADAQRLRPP